MKLAISLLDADWSQINSIKSALQTQRIQYLHLDIMDGHLTSQVSFGPTICQLVKPFKMHLSGHFMVKIPSQRALATYLQPYLNLLDSFILHYEALTVSQIRTLLNWKRQFYTEVGLAIQLTTDWTKLQPYLPELDWVIVMLVPIGAGGQSIQPVGLNNLQQLLTYCQMHQLSVKIIADGGINATTIDQLPAAVHQAVIGSYCWKGQSITSQLQKLQSRLNSN